MKESSDRMSVKQVFKRMTLLGLALATGLSQGALLVSAQTESSSSASGQVKMVDPAESSSSYQEADTSVSREAYNQLEELLKQNSQVKINPQAFYQTDDDFKADQQNFAVTVDMLRLYTVNSFEKELENEFNFEEGGGGLVVMHVSITNKTKETVHYPIEELKLSYNEASLEVSPSYQLYPAEDGNLAQTLSDNKGTIDAGQTVSGYLVFGLSASSVKRVQEDGYFYIKVVSPKRSESDITGISVNSLGDEQLLYLPAKDEAAKSLKESATHVPDRLTTEYWGTKQVLADDKPKLKESDEGIDVTITRLEVSDFQPNSYNEESFRNFKYGAVIVSVEYDVTNKSQKTLLPVDGNTVLNINGDPINSDYVLTNQVYGKELAPGQTYHVIKTFALDKSRYQEHWQGHDYSLTISVPEKKPVVDSASSSQEGQEGQADPETQDAQGQGQAGNPAPEVTTYSVTFNLVPRLIQTLSEELKLQPANSTSNSQNP